MVQNMIRGRSAPPIRDTLTFLIIPEIPRGTGGESTGAVDVLNLKRTEGALDVHG